jgi:hypothetical protein
MSEKRKKTGGGPKTQQGKKISSQNSIVHGATSNNAVSDEQKALVEGYVQELQTHYQPSSPLEILQIQRIALCKVKLDALYELEQVKLQIATEDLKRDSNLVMQKVHSEKDLTQDFALRLSNGSKLDLPMELTPELLSVFSSEIRALGGELQAEDDFNRALPSLSQHIHEIATRLGAAPTEVLLRLGSSINGLLKAKSTLYYEIQQYLDSLKKSRQEEAEEANPSKGGKQEVDEDRDVAKLNEVLKVLVDLDSIVTKASQVAEDYSRMRVLMLRSVTLGGEESDRLLRYQTT